MITIWTQAAERLPERGTQVLWAIDIYPSGFVYKLGVLSLDGDEILTPEEVRPHYWVTPKCLWMPIPALPYREAVEAAPVLP